MGSDVRDADVLQISQRRIQRIQRDEIRHAYGIAGGAGLRHSALESVGIKRILQMQPAARMRGQSGTARGGDADDAAAVDAQRPLMRAGDEDIRADAVEHHAAQGLGEIHGDDGLRSEAADGFLKWAPIDAMTIVEAHQRDLNELGALVEQGREMLDVERAVHRFPDAQRGRMDRAQPWSDAGREIEIADDHFIASAQLQRGGEEIVSLRTARAERHFRSLQANHPRAHFAARFHLGEMPVASLHAAQLVLPVSLDGFTGAAWGNAFRGGVEIGDPGERGKVPQACGVGKHSGRRLESLGG